MKVFIGDLIAAAEAEKAVCEKCHGTGKVTKEVGPASIRTWEESCPHGISVGTIRSRILAEYDLKEWGSVCWHGTLDFTIQAALPELLPAFSIVGDFAIPDPAAPTWGKLRRQTEEGLRKTRDHEKLMAAYRLLS